MSAEKFGNWTVEARIRDTPYGELVRVRHEGREEKATLLACRAEDQQLRSRFLLWGDALAQIEHPSIVKIEESGLALGGVPFCVTKGDRHATLLARRKGGELDRVEGLRALAAIADAMALAHRKELVHGLLGAGTVLAEQGHYRVVDLGLWSMVLEPSGLASKALREENALYLAPEQVAGNRADRRTDVFAWAILACELLTGRHPYESSSTGATLRAILQNPIPRFDRDPWHLPDALVGLLTRSLRKDPLDRIDNFEVIQKALERISDPFLVVTEELPVLSRLEELRSFTDVEGAAAEAASRALGADEDEDLAAETSRQARPLEVAADDVAERPQVAEGPTLEPAATTAAEPEPAGAATTEPAAEEAPPTPDEVPEIAEEPTSVEQQVEAPVSERASTDNDFDLRGLFTQPIQPINDVETFLAKGAREESSDEEESPGEGRSEPASEPSDDFDDDWSEGLGGSDDEAEAEAESGVEDEDEAGAESAEEESSEEPDSAISPAEAEPPAQASPPRDESPVAEEEPEELEVAPDAPTPALSLAPPSEATPAGSSSRLGKLLGAIAVAVVVVLAVAWIWLGSGPAEESVAMEEVASSEEAKAAEMGRFLQTAAVALERGELEQALEAVMAVLQVEPDREEAIGLLGRIVGACGEDVETARTEALAANAEELVPVIVSQAEEKATEAQAVLDQGDWEEGVRHQRAAAELYRLAAKQAELFAKPAQGEVAKRERSLLFAAEESDAEELRRLLEEGNGRWGEAEEKALQLAMTLGHVDVVRVLFEVLPAGVDLDELLLEAALEGQPEMVGTLLDLGADIEARDPLGRTALLQAAADGHPLTASLLLERGADPEAKDELGRSAIELARRAGHPQVQEVLRKAGSSG